MPLREIGTEHHLSDTRIVPEQSVPRTGENERYRYLRIPLRQFYDAALQIQIRLLILSHSVQLLVLCLEPDCQCNIIRPANGMIHSWIQLQRTAEAFIVPAEAVSVIFLKNHFSFCIEKAKLPRGKNFAGDLPVCNLCILSVDGDSGRLLFLFSVKAVIQITDSSCRCAANTQAITPAFNA